MLFLLPCTHLSLRAIKQATEHSIVKASEQCYQSSLGRSVRDKIGMVEHGLEGVETGALGDPSVSNLRFAIFRFTAQKCNLVSILAIGKRDLLTFRTSTQYQWVHDKPGLFRGIVPTWHHNVLVGHNI